jgi:serine/threonine protein kinase
VSFISQETDVVTKEPVKRLISNPMKRKSLLQLLTHVAAKDHPRGIPREELRKVEGLAAFLERATALDPATRLTVAEAMQMKFIVPIKQQIAAQQSALRKQNK